MKNSIFYLKILSFRSQNVIKLFATISFHSVAADIMHLVLLLSVTQEIHCWVLLKFLIAYHSFFFNSEFAKFFSIIPLLHLIILMLNPLKQYVSGTSQLNYHW